jgi:microsomal dipeptidase-like Zn-dependent dipeptidase
MYKYWFARRLGHYRRPGREQRTPPSVPPGVEDPGYVRGMENPNEFINVARWMIKNGYSDAETAKVVGGNALRLLEKVW